MENTVFEISSTVYSYYSVGIH